MCPADSIHAAATKLQSGFFLPSVDLGAGYLFQCVERDPNNNCVTYHLGVDRGANEGDAVYAVARGEIVWYNPQSCGFLAVNPDLRGPVMLVKHRNSSGNYFYALYGHIKNPKQTTPGSIVQAGEQIAEIGPFYRDAGDNYVVTGVDCNWATVTQSYASYKPHLHFGIYVGTSAPPAPYGYNGTTGEWTDPITYLENHHPYATIAGQSLSSYSAPPAATLTFVYDISHQGTTSIPNVVLGARIRSSDPQGQWIDDPANDRIVSLEPGEKEYSRQFRVPATATPGFYDVGWVIYDQGTGVWIDNKEILKSLTISSTPNSPEYYILSGTVIDPNASAVQGTVYAWEQTGANQGNYCSISNGSYRMALFPGSYGVYAYLYKYYTNGYIYYNTNTQYTTISSDSTLSLNTPAFTFYHVSGKVSNSAGTGISGVSIRLYGSSSSYTSTLSDGTYDAIVTPGTYTLQVEPWLSSGYSKESIYNIQVNGDVIRNATLARGLVLSGTVIDSNGTRHQTYMSAYEINGSNSGNYGWGNSDGTYQLPLSQGTYVVQAMVYLPISNGYSYLYLPQRTINLSADMVADFVYPANNYSHLRGKVTDVNGVPQANVRLSANDRLNRIYAYAMTSADGSYDLLVLDGTYSVQIAAPAATFPPFVINKVDISGNTTRNIRLSVVYTLLEQTIAALSPGLELGLDVFDIISTAASNTYNVVVQSVKELLQIVLNWPGSEMKLTIYRPSGNIYGTYQSTMPPIIVDIPNPDQGTWRCEVTPIQIPHDNYPIALAVGESPNKVPVAEAGGPYSGNRETLISFDASNSYDPDGRIVSYQWDWNNDGIYDEASASSTITHSWSSDYSGIVRLMVTDNDGATATDTALVDIGLDGTPPVVSIDRPAAGEALQGGVTLSANATDESGVSHVYYSIRDQGGNILAGYENMEAAFNASHGRWEYLFDTSQLLDGYYRTLAKGVDSVGNVGWSDAVPFSIRNWAIVKLLPPSENNKAGRTMPVKFALRIAAEIDPLQHFVYNEELEIRIYDGFSNHLRQTSIWGSKTTDYRIDTAGDLYITNFKTDGSAATYRVEIWRKGTEFMIGSFVFTTQK
jgi:hypothetical protein